MAETTLPPGPVLHGPRDLELEQQVVSIGFHDRRKGTATYDVLMPGIARVFGAIEDYQAEFERWFGWYQPRDFCECFLVEMSVNNSIRRRLLVRGENALTEMKAEQAEREWDAEQEAEVERLSATLKADPAAAMDGLNGSAAGCRWVIGRWQGLEQMRERNGYWTTCERDQAIELQGVKAEIGCLGKLEMAYLTWLHCLLAQPRPDRSELAVLLAPETLPESLRGGDLARALPTQARARQWLGELTEWKLSQVRRREERLRVEHEVPARDSAVDALLKMDKELVRAARMRRSYDRMIGENHKALCDVRAMHGESAPDGPPG
jgi:hypothetical protein